MHVAAPAEENASKKLRRHSVSIIIEAVLAQLTVGFALIANFAKC